MEWHSKECPTLRPYRFSKTFVLDGRENEEREKEVINKIQNHENCWNEIYWQHKSCAIIASLRQICDGKNNTLQAANMKHILGNLDLANNQYNPDAAAGGTKSEIQKNFKILRNLIINKSSSVTTIRQILIDGQNLSGIDTIDDAISSFLEFCQTDPIAFMQSSNSVGKMIKDIVLNPVSSSSIQKMFLTLAVNFIKHDYTGVNYANELIQLTMKLIENRVLEESITTLYYDFMPEFIIYGSIGEDELVEFVERLLNVESFANKSNCNNLFKKLTLLPSESFQNIK